MPSAPVFLCKKCIQMHRTQRLPQLMLHARLHVPLHSGYPEERPARFHCGVSEVFKKQSLANNVEDSNCLGTAVFKKKSVSSSLGMWDHLPFYGSL